MHSTGDFLKFAEHHETGRSCTGDGATIVEFESATGGLANAIVFDAASPLLFAAIDSAYDFLSFPMVHGLSELIVVNVSENAVLYQTGSVRTVAELITRHKRAKKGISRKAVAELCLLTSMILVESAENGTAMGVAAHGDLRPDRIVLSSTGDLSILGYGLPDPSVIGWSREDAEEPPPALMAYAPPERFDGTPEDIRSDIYSLALIAVELITGKPLLSGSFAAIQESVASDKLASAIQKNKKVIGPPFADLLSRAVAADPEDRVSPSEFVETSRRLVEGVSGGDSLAKAFAPIFSARKGKALTSVTDDVASGDDAATDTATDDRFSQPTKSDKPSLSKSTKDINLDEAPKRPVRKSKGTEKDDSVARPKRKSKKTEDEARPKRKSAKTDVTPEAPKRRRAKSVEEAPPKPKRRATAKKGADEEAPPKPKRRATAKKGADEVASETPDQATKPRRRSTAKVPDETDSATPSRRRRISAQSQDDNNAPPRRRRASAGAEDDTETAAPRRRRGTAQDDTPDTDDSPKPRRRR